MNFGLEAAVRTAHCGLKAARFRASCGSSPGRSVAPRSFSLPANESCRDKCRYSRQGSCFPARKESAYNGDNCSCYISCGNYVATRGAHRQASSARGGRGRRDSFGVLRNSIRPGLCAPDRFQHRSGAYPAARSGYRHPAARSASPARRGPGPVERDQGAQSRPGGGGHDRIRDRARGSRGHAHRGRRLSDQAFRHG